ncbi:MAG: hypothetical protein KGI51_09820, partial [Rhodospirillales bacterium]|nr:hypothetical protein [Rhodospirillales bacterium]
MIRRWLLAALLLLAPAAARACDPATGDAAGTVQIFWGTIGAYPVRVGLQFDRGGAVAGRYGYANSPGTIALDGTLA